MDCDLVIGWMKDLDGNLSKTIKAIGVRDVIVRSPFSTEIRATHQCDRFLESMNEPPFEHTGDLLLKVTEPLIQYGRVRLESAGLSIGQSLAVIHPGSGSANKCVAPEILSTVIRTLHMSNVTPVVLEGPADRKQVERLLQSFLNPPIVLRELDLLTVAGVLAQARLYIGQDSGITHMAGLIGIATIALFGPTDPARWAPRGTHVTVMRGAPCLCRSWDEVSLCKDKPCLDISTDSLAALCQAHLEEAAI
jgi:ADP-heptose:LPS heptosyltransferase